jgi:tRNASer (uridine44-2'-O)-methyltransferase
MKNGDNHGGQNPFKLDSHSLIDSDSFVETYTRLKEKYGKPLEDQWNETTDPKKFIYEDIAISSYLIVLWKQERINTGNEQKQSFVDLGCGNGLLVHILSGEGFRGYGIDLRRRKIWDILSADLREETIVPSNDHLFSDVDWIIGNHSDELSPWIPVISARSSFNSNYFLLPCCAYEFSGVKFNKKTEKSQYLSFVDYLLEISNICGFKVTNLDRLKIPSTKRICLIGINRTYDESEYENEKLKIQEFIDKSNGDNNGNNEKWSESFKPREKVQEIRNCVRIDNNLKETIWRRIFDELLNKSENYDEKYPKWNKGGELTIPEVVELISQDELNQLKSEFGGVQTLLKNKHQCFHVYQGTVRIRIPKSLSELELNNKKKGINKRTVSCYFYHHHDSGCPLDESQCPYQHN